MRIREIRNVVCLLLLTSSSVIAVLIQGCTLIGGQQRLSTGHVRGLDPRLVKLSKEEAEAEKAGNFKKAEALCDQITALGVPKRIVDRTRYLIYTKEGRTADSYRALKSVVTDTPSSGSSDASDPVMLTRFGMIAEKVGKTLEAESAFLKATQNKMCYLGRSFYPLVSRKSSGRQIKSAALFCAGIKLAFQEHYSDRKSVV